MITRGSCTSPTRRRCARNLKRSRTGTVPRWCDGRLGAVTGKGKDMTQRYEYVTVKVPVTGTGKRSDKKRDKILRRWADEGWEIDQYIPRGFAFGWSDTVIMRREYRKPAEVHVEVKHVPTWS